jgi:hypothetical protein
MSLRLILIFGLAALYVAYRLYQNYRTKAGTKSLLHQLQQNPATAEAFAEGLDMLVRRGAVTHPAWEEALAPYVSGQVQRVGEFVIDLIQPLSAGRYLLVTTADYREATRASKGIETSELHNLNFVFGQEGEQWVLRSDLHTDLIDKNLRTDFAQAGLPRRGGVS